MKPTLHTLKNGMRAILVPQKGAPSMTIMVFVKVGSRYETREVNGASHFVEHIMFKGTKRRPATLDISRALDRYGAEYNAFTSKDLTAYYIKMDAQHTELAVDLLHDMLFNSKFDPKEIDRERGVIIEEINMYEDNPRMHIEDMLEEALYPDSTLGWNIAGPRSTIREVSRDALKDYHDRYYIPSRITIAVAGKVKPGLLGLLEKSFGKVKEPTKPADVSFGRFLPPAKLERPVAFQKKQTEQVQLGLAFHGFGYGDPRKEAASLLSLILGGTMSSRLFVQVRERRGLCYSISASHQSYEDTGVFSVMSGLEKNRVEEAIKLIRSELLKTTKELVTAEELREAKDYLRGKTALAFEDSSHQADWYGKQWVFQHKLESPEARLKRYEKVTAAMVRSAAEELFRKPAMAASVIGPFVSSKDVERWFR